AARPGPATPSRCFATNWIGTESGAIAAHNPIISGDRTAKPGAVGALLPGTTGMANVSSAARLRSAGRRPARAGASARPRPGPGAPLSVRPAEPPPRAATGRAPGAPLPARHLLRLP